MVTTNWLDLQNISNSGIAFDKLITTFSNNISSCTYKVTIKSKYYRIQEWMTESLLKSIRKRDKLQRTIRNLPENDPRHVQYRNFRNVLKSEMRTAKRQYYTKKLALSSGNFNTSSKRKLKSA